MLVYLLANALLIRSLYFREHVGNPGEQLGVAFSLFLLYGMFSVLGWILVGIPAVLVLSPGRVAKWRWPIDALIGAALGSLALLLLLLVLGAGRLSFEHTGGLWPFAILVSAVAFVVYGTLERRRVA